MYVYIVCIYIELNRYTHGEVIKQRTTRPSENQGVHCPKRKTHSTSAPVSTRICLTSLYIRHARTTHQKMMDI